MALNVGELTATLSMDTSNYSKGLKQAEQSASSFENKFGTAAKVAAGAAIALGAAVLGAAYKGIKLAGDMEKTAGSFKVLLGSAGAAQKMMEDLQKFADTTPFEFPEVATAAKNLLALGIAAKDIPSTLTSLGDVAAGVNIPFGELADIYGKMNVQGRIFAEDMNQLQGRGIPIVQELAKQFGVSTTQINQMVSDGKIGFAEVEKAFKSLTGEGGKFHGMMDELSKTLPGLLSTMSDAMNRTLTMLGQKLIEVFDIKGLIKNVSDAFDSFNKKVKELGLAMAISKSMSTEWKIALILIAGALSGIAIAILAEVIPALGLMAANAVVAIGAFLPFIAVGAAVAAIAFVIYAAWEENLFGIRDLIEGLSKDFTNFWNGIGSESDTASSIFGITWSDVFGFLKDQLKESINKWYRYYAIIKNLAGQIKTGDFSLEGLMKDVNVDFAGEMFTTLPGKAKTAWSSMGNTFTSTMKKAADITNRNFDKMTEGIFGKFQKTPVIAGIDVAEITKSTAAITQSTDAIKTQKEEVDKVKEAYANLTANLSEVDARYAVYGKSVNVAAEKTKLIKEAMVTLRTLGVDPASASFMALQDQLNKLNPEKTLSVIQKIKDTLKTAFTTDLASTLGKISTLSGGTNPFAAFTSGASDIVSGIKSFKSGDIIGGINAAVSGVKKVIGSITGSAGKKEFKKQIAEQSAANLKAAQEQLQTYKDYAAQITAFGKSSLVSITGMAADQINMINSLDLTSHAEQVTKRIKTLLGHATGRATLWTYTFDQLGAESAKAFLERFMEIASGLSTSVGSAFSSGIKAFLGGKADWLTTLRDGIKDAIIDAITTAVLQSTIIKGALGTLLGDLASGLTAGMDVSGIIAQIGATIPIVAKQLEEVLTPLRGAVTSAFSGSIPAMADGGVVSRPTMALIGEAGPEAVVPLNQMGNMGGGGPQTIIIELDKKVLIKTVVEGMPSYVRFRTGVSL